MQQSSAKRKANEMKTMNWVKPGDRIDVYERPYSDEMPEGSGIVKAVHNIDRESAYVSVDFDDDKIYGYPSVDRLVLPQHVRKSVTK